MDLADEARVGRDELDDLLLSRVGLARLRQGEEAGDCEYEHRQKPQ